ncbi:M56 family metallopeptidase [Occallatibacter savannae]|uniref:M56 family metallopeptidase n=1 Tax=Occallatibacter savannae TaxID=1002691 RepID=UPI000D69A8EC|nr:M56 family metallopeptidase [Occallatibacter savannae]
MTSIPEAVAWTLIHFCWQAAAVAAAYRLLSALLARRSAETRYTAALASLMLMLACSVVTLAWELRSESAPATFTSTAANFAAPLTLDLPRIAAPGMIQSRPDVQHITLASLLPWIDGLWVAGVLALSIRSLGGWWYLRRLRQSAITQAPETVRASFDRICSALGLSRAVALRVCTAIDGPMTIGTLRAIILLPLSALTSLGPDELEVVLAHELAHVRRADFFWNILQTIAETLFFFHPAVWWINARIRHERELCCDDMALKICPNPVTYASALYRLEEHRSRHLRLAMALDGHASHSTLLMRIARILGEPMTRIPSTRLRPFSLVAASAGLVALLVPAPHVLASLNPAPQPTASPVVSTVVTPAVHVNATAAVAVKAKPSPYPAIQTTTDASVDTTIAAETQPQAKPEPASQPHSDYIDRMKAAGYDVDLDKMINMKIQGITPEYAQQMANAGFGKLSADDLVSCKIQGVTPEYIADLKKQGYQIDDVKEAVSFKIFNITPEFVSGMKAAGFDNLNSKQLLNMRIQGATPEFARTLKQKFPGVTAEDVVQARIFHIDDEFIAQASRHGFTNLPFKKLVQLRISGLLDDESVKQ